MGQDESENAKIFISPNFFAISSAILGPHNYIVVKRVWDEKNPAFKVRLVTKISTEIPFPSYEAKCVVFDFESKAKTLFIN